jgi:hypothetical protein
MPRGEKTETEGKAVSSKTRMTAKALYGQPFALLSRMMASFIVSMQVWEEVHYKRDETKKPQAPALFRLLASGWDQ